MTDLIVVLIAAVPLSLLRGFVLVTLWGWFIVPTFAAPALSIPVALGVDLTVGLFKGARKSDENEHVGKALLRGAIYPIVALGLGAFWRLWI